MSGCTCSLCITHLPKITSKHNSLLLSLYSNQRPSRKKPFRFEIMWLQDNAFRKIVQQEWEKIVQQEWEKMTSAMTISGRLTS